MSHGGEHPSQRLQSAILAGLLAELAVEDFAPCRDLYPCGSKFPVDIQTSVAQLLRLAAKREFFSAPGVLNRRAVGRQPCAKIVWSDADRKAWVDSALSTLRTQGGKGL